ncbi:HAD superfamily hydrolase (TIGR01509 family) [Ciceribacter lividus]|uniref:HAD superfamily hydrolase (TIGR01509 family) n=1 Tax=Ciceribacter lividus TaxID=1197950 RepID=A0A6I7HJI9_9HYPH|nr:HAD family phosphatase [Ciceribacter lividus]RCW21474.1 HAD superfamily hydrolase (TIGR01509 family) [Ciceribacter lividus]
MLPRLPRAVVFDMDGLILDSEILYRKSVISAATEEGLPIGPSIYEAMMGQPWPGIAQLLIDHYGEDFDPDAFRIIWIDHFNRLIETELKLKAGVTALLDTLDQHGIPRAICTSSAHHQVRHHLEGFGLLPRFDHVVAQGDYARGKPAPDPYLAAAERLGVAPADCLALEDSHNGIRSAAAAGMMAVMVPDLLAPTDEIVALCARVAGSLEECCAFFTDPLAAERA